MMVGAWNWEVANIVEDSAQFRNFLYAIVCFFLDATRPFCVHLLDASFAGRIEDAIKKRKAEMHARVARMLPHIVIQSFSILPHM